MRRLRSVVQRLQRTNMATRCNRCCWGLYLLTIGVISFTWANAPRFKRMRRERGLPYSHCIVERWADRLGGIRDQK